MKNKPRIKFDEKQNLVKIREELDPLIQLFEACGWKVVTVPNIPVKRQNGKKLAKKTSKMAKHTRKRRVSGKRWALDNI